MKEQHFKNHTRFAPKVYYLALLSGLLVFLAAAAGLFICDENDAKMLKKIEEGKIYDFKKCLYDIEASKQRLKNIDKMTIEGLNFYF